MPPTQLPSLLYWCQTTFSFLPLHLSLSMHCCQHSSLLGIIVPSNLFGTNHLFLSMQCFPHRFPLFCHGVQATFSLLPFCFLSTMSFFAVELVFVQHSLLLFVVAANNLIFFAIALLFFNAILPTQLPCLCHWAKFPFSLQITSFLSM